MLDVTDFNESTGSEGELFEFYFYTIYSYLLEIDDDVFETQDRYFPWEQENSILDASTFLDLSSDSKQIEWLSSYMHAQYMTIL